MFTIQSKITKNKHLRWLCRAMASVAGGLSVWSNYLHAAHMGNVGKAISMAPPLLFVAAFELGSRIPIHKSDDWYLRWGRLAGTIGVGGIGAYLSYFHQRDAFFRYTSGDMSTAVMLPLSIDGLMVVAAVSLYILNRRIEDLEIQQATQAAKAAAKTAGSTETVLQGLERSGDTKKARIARLLAAYPESSAKQIAELANASEGYVNNLMSELRRANNAELVVVQ